LSIRLAARRSVSAVTLDVRKPMVSVNMPVSNASAAWGVISSPHWGMSSASMAAVATASGATMLMAAKRVLVL